MNSYGKIASVVEIWYCDSSNHNCIYFNPIECEFFFEK